jgi:transposase
LVGRAKAEPEATAKASTRAKWRSSECRGSYAHKVLDTAVFLLKLQLDRLERVESDIAFLEQRLQEKLKPYADQLARLDEIPGVDWTLAAVIIAELGVDTSVFPSVSQLTSWAGVCPGNNESAGKRKSSRVPKGNVYLKTALVEAANAAALPQT